MKDDKKQPSASRGSHPDGGSEGDDNPWDDDESGRTLATDGPTFELPSNIPSPVSAPPPPPPPAPAMMRRPTPRPISPVLANLPPARKKQATMLGFGPPGPDLPLPPRPAGAVPRASVPEPPARAPAVDDGADDDGWSSADEQEDAPTMAAASPVSSPSVRRPFGDPHRAPASASAPASSAAYKPPGMVGAVDANAATSAVPASVPPADDLASEDDVEDVEEATRSLSRDELLQGHGAQVVVGDDEAMGDDATLAAAPGDVNGLAPAIAAVLAEARERAASQPNLPTAPAFPVQGLPQGRHPSSARLPAAPPHDPVPQPLGMGMAPVVPAWNEPAQAYGSPPPSSFDPRTAQQAPPYGQPGPQAHPGHPGQAPLPPSDRHPFGQGMPMGYAPPQGPAGYGPDPGAAAMGQHPHGHPPMAAPPPGGSQPSRLTPQVILLIAAGAVCVAIFAVGVFLFVTTKF